MNRVKEALEALKRNEIILVTDDEDRENEGDMICAGENVTGEMINIMATYARGLSVLQSVRKSLVDFP